MTTSTIHVIVNAVVVAKLTYMPRHRGAALRRPRIVNDWKRSFVAASLVDFAFLIKMSLEDLVTDADDKLFNLILHSNTMFYTIYFLVVQILIIILGEGVITLC